jgi:serine phosphatase RsbU (regulator of sigma subunit)
MAAGDAQESTLGNGTTLGLNFELQRGEARRAEILGGVLLVIVAVALVRQFLGIGGATFASFFLTTIFAGIAIGYAMTIRRIVQRAIAEDRLLPERFWLWSVVIESTLPTLAIVLVAWFTRLPPMDAVRGPGMLLYFIFAVAAVLRLRPRLCVLGGVLSGAQDFMLLSVAVASSKERVPRDLLPLVYLYPLLVFMAWGLAGQVARELRRHVEAGLRLAEARARLAEVTGELAVARQIQQRLMPRGSLTLPGYEIAGWNRPANQTGGDYFDWITLADGRVAVAIADVTGHGVGPALIMAVCRAYARATIPESSPLNRGLGRLNSLLSDDIDEGRFVTSAYAVLDPREGAVQLLSAGHGPTIWQREDGTIEMFGGDGPPLGVVADFDFDPPRSIRLEPGESLLLVTDGFIEASDDAGRMFGIGRLREFLAAHAGAHPEAVLAGLDAEVRRHVGRQPQADDMTAVMIRRNA